LLAGGGAAALAADDVAFKLRAIAASMLHCDAGQIALGGGMAVNREHDSAAVPIPAVAHAAYSLGYILAAEIDPALEATRIFKPSNISHVPDQGGHIQPFACFSNALHLVVVEVDRETGVVSVLRHVAVHDCGKMINPRLVKGQFTGGIVMGLGAALTEQLLHSDEGRLTTDSFKTYLLPRATDIPDLEIIHQETPSPFNPLGVKGAGESGFAGSYAAIFGAVNDALAPLGAAVAGTPITPERVLQALDDRRGRQGSA